MHLRTTGTATRHQRAGERGRMRGQGRVPEPHPQAQGRGFGVGRRVSDRLVLLGEVAGNDLNATDEKRVLLDVGLRRKISGSQSVSAALGRDVYAGGDQRRQNYLTLNYQKIFGD